MLKEPGTAAAIGTMVRRTPVCRTATSPLTRARLATTISAAVVPGLPPDFYALLHFVFCLEI